MQMLLLTVQGSAKAFCILCADNFDVITGEQIATLLEGVTVAGMVCPKCLADGPVAGAERFRKRAREYRASADHYERSAGDLAKCAGWPEVKIGLPRMPIGPAIKA